MRNAGSHDVADRHAEGQKRHSVSRLPPIALAPTPQSMLQDDIMHLPALSLNPNSGRRAAEDWNVAPLGSSRALSSGVVRRRVTAGTGLEPLSLKPLRQPTSTEKGGNASSLPSASTRLPRQPLFQASALSPRGGLDKDSPSSFGGRAGLPRAKGPSDRRDIQRTHDILSGASPRRPQMSEGQSASRPQGLPLRPEASVASIGVPGEVSPRSAKRHPGGVEPAIVRWTSTQSAPNESQGRAPDPKHAAKCAAVANLQRLFFEEVGRSGDANAAAAAALLRLAEESRPQTELTPRRMHD
mmetsp:Transcript_110679/g.173159  ORF Transcript_110679/g.173159 Transcript_110679/m.173159 type:complete len:298 (-) Transcript_110679:160-1053(-)